MRGWHNFAFCNYSYWQLTNWNQTNFAKDMQVKIWVTFLPIEFIVNTPIVFNSLQTQLVFLNNLINMHAVSDIVLCNSSESAFTILNNTLYTYTCTQLSAQLLDDICNKHCVLILLPRAPCLFSTNWAQLVITGSWSTKLLCLTSCQEHIDFMEKTARKLHYIKYTSNHLN